LLAILVVVLVYFPLTLSIFAVQGSTPAGDAQANASHQMNFSEGMKQEQQQPPCFPLSYMQLKSAEVKFIAVYTPNCSSPSYHHRIS
jgi:hypothetical protein